jgi:thiamine-monophosphate kinase
MMGEFELINRFFKRPAQNATLGIGDDCALWLPQPGQQLAVSSDMLVEGRHFFSTVNPENLGHKALAVNLSDLAACGAKPLAFTLALALPKADENWLEKFSKGLFALADVHGCELIGGDTTQGPLNICITVLGEVSIDQALLRQGAAVGDDIYISGQVGDARLALEVLRGRESLEPSAFNRCKARLETPQPRIALGLALRGIATSAIDVSDGLIGDLSHILHQSHLGAEIETGWLEGSAALSEDVLALPWDKRMDMALAGGDDYELAFTAPTAKRDLVLAAAQASQTALTRIGKITANQILKIVSPDGNLLSRKFSSFDHFSQSPHE